MKFGNSTTLSKRNKIGSGSVVVDVLFSFYSATIFRRDLVCRKANRKSHSISSSHKYKLHRFGLITNFA